MNKNIILKKKKAISSFLCGFLAITVLLGLLPAMETKADDNYIPIYRLLYKGTGEHFYTTDSNERNQLIIRGWDYEGISCFVPDHSSDPIYRLKNTVSGEHLYTSSIKERDFCKENGWEDEGIAWYSGGDTSVYRLNSPNPKGANAHHYTMDSNEINALVGKQWSKEGIVWSGLLAKDKADPNPVPKGADYGKKKVGDILSKDEYSFREDWFKVYEIGLFDEVYKRIKGKSYVDNPNISFSDIRYLRLLHYDFDHNVRVGELIVNKDIAEDIKNIFTELFMAEYEIESMRLIDDFWAGDGFSSDEASIEANNSSAFCYRQMTGSTSLSLHALGMAIDINPIQNPYIKYKDGVGSWTHSKSDGYIDRDSGLDHMIASGDICYNIFKKYGFTWGGDWTNPKDYQHFEMKR